MPPRVTADTGMDALSQAHRGAPQRGGFNPYADALPLEAIETIGRYLPQAFANGSERRGPGGDAGRGDDDRDGLPDRRA